MTISIEKVCPSCSQRFSPDEKALVCQHDGTALVPVTSDSLTGTVINEKFELLEVIGTGGSSTVYRAKHLSLGRFAAFKLLRSDLVSTVERIKRFEQEAHLASSLNHQNICAVYDCGLLDTGQPYLVLENVEGKDLEQVLQQGRVLPERRAVRLLKQIAAGLKAAHEHGVLHRDLKPGNIMLIDNDQVELVKLIDFGLAKGFGTGSGEDLTATGSTIGTPAYMSPEQVRGDELDARSDIYSFGCVMYEMLTGRKAFEGKTAFETMQKHLNQQPPSLTCGEYVVPFALREVALKCLHKEPVDRYQSMSDVLRDIERIERNEEFRDTEYGENERSGPSRWVVFSMCALVVLGLLATYAIPRAPEPAVRLGTPTIVDRPISPAPAGHSVDPATQKLLTEFESLKSVGKFDAAERVAKRAEQLLAKSGREHTYETLLVSRALQNFYLQNYRRSEATPYIKAVFEAESKLAPAHSAPLLAAHRTAAKSFKDAAREQLALPHLEAAAALSQRLFGENSVEHYEALWALAGVEARHGSAAKADAYYKALIDMTQPVELDVKQARQQLLTEACSFYVDQGKTKEAKSAADRSIGSLTARTPPELQVKIYRTAAFAAERRHDFGEAVLLIDRAIEASHVMAAGQEPFYLTDELLTMKGSYLRQAKDYAAAEKILRQAMTQISKSHLPETHDYRWALSQYIKLLRETSRNAEADAIERSGRFEGGIK